MRSQEVCYILCEKDHQYNFLRNALYISELPYVQVQYYTSFFSSVSATWIVKNHSSWQTRVNGPFHV